MKVVVDAVGAAVRCVDAFRGEGKACNVHTIGSPAIAELVNLSAVHSDEKPKSIRY